MTTYTYNEKKTCILAVDRLLAKTGNQTLALKQVSEREDISTANLRNWYADRSKIFKACANGWGKETKLSEEKIKRKNQTVAVARYSRPEPQFHQKEVHSTVKVVRMGEYMEATATHSTKVADYTQKGGEKRSNMMAFERIAFGQEGPHMYQKTQQMYLCAPGKKFKRGHDSSDSDY